MINDCTSELEPMFAAMSLKEQLNNQFISDKSLSYVSENYPICGQCIERSRKSLIINANRFDILPENRKVFSKSKRVSSDSL